jgi:hypothetical protein
MADTTYKVAGGVSKALKDIGGGAHAEHKALVGVVELTGDLTIDTLGALTASKTTDVDTDATLASLLRGTLDELQARTVLLTEIELSTRPYIAPAVDFDGSTYLTNASATVPVTDKFAFSVWFKLSDPNGLGESFGTCRFFHFADGDATLDVVFDEDGSDYAISGALYSDPPDYSSFFTVGYDTIADPVFTGFTPGTWYHALWVAVADLPRKWKLYVNGVSVGTLTTDSNDLPFVVTSEGFTVSFGASPDGSTPLVGSIADAMAYVGTALLDVDGSLPTETLRLFIDADGKPVNPARAVAALGTPTMLFSGDAASFATNQGSGGAFATTGTLTDAASSPSD